MAELPNVIRMWNFAGFGFSLIVNAAWMKCVSGLSCSDVKKSGSGSKFSVEELKSIPDEDFVSCLVYLGRDPLGDQEGKYLWKKFAEIYENDLYNIPDRELQQLGWIIRGISPKEMENLTLAEIDTISAFGRYHNLSQAQLQALAERIREDWNAKDPTDYTHYDLMALNQILCGFNLTDLAAIRPDSYREATGVLSILRDCPKEPLQVLASLAVSPEAFDEPSTWHSSQPGSVGCVLNGMTREDIALIPPEGFESLTPEVIGCLSEETLRSMGAHQLKRLTPAAAASVSSSQKSFLDFDRRKSIDEAYEGELIRKISKNGASSTRNFILPWCTIGWENSSSLPASCFCSWKQLAGSSSTTVSAICFSFFLFYLF